MREPENSDELVRRLLRSEWFEAPVRPFPGIRVHRRSWLLSSGRVLVGLALVLLAATGGLSLRALREERKEPSTTLANPTSGAAVRAPATPDSAYGLLVDHAAGSLTLRSETGTTDIAMWRARAFAIRPDGGAMAYWTSPVVDGATPELNVYDFIARSDRLVLRLAAERPGGAGWLLWSLDGQGVAVALQDSSARFEGADAPRLPQRSWIRLLDLSNSTTSDVLETAGGWVRPIFWDRAAGVSSALARGVGEASDRVLTRTQSGTREERLPALVLDWSVRTGDRGFAAGLAERACGLGTCREVWAWRSGAPTLARVSSPHDDGTILDFSFRRGSDELVALVRSGSAPRDSLIVWPIADPTQRREVAVFSAVPGALSTRPDGSAAVVGSLDPNTGQVQLVDLDRGSSVRLAGPADVRASVKLR